VLGDAIDGHDHRNFQRTACSGRLGQKETALDGDELSNRQFTRIGGLRRLAALTHFRKAVLDVVDPSSEAASEALSRAFSRIRQLVGQ
jgi:hypothetical protein